MSIEGNAGARGNISGRAAAPRVSVVIPVPPGMGDPSSLAALGALSFPRENIEVLVVEGRQPARQRNLAAAESTGDYLFFLDDDSVVDPGLFERNLSFYSDPKIAGVGGPALPLPPKSTVEAASDVVLASLFGDPRGCMRFAARGRARPASEDELILCNLSMRRDVFERFGGFPEALYPNEENALFQKVLDAGDGWRFMYVPDAPIRRPRPSTVGRFAAKIFRYGMGRYEQTRLRPSAVCALRLATVLFPLYWLALAPLLMVTPWALAPAALYVVGNVAMAAKIWWTVKSVGIAAASLVLFPVMHVAYPSGIAWAATLRRLFGGSKVDPDIRVRRVQSFGQAAAGAARAL